MSLFQFYQPEHKRIVKRAPFARAVHAYPKTKIEVSATHNWMNAQPLRKWLHNCLKYADNILRRTSGIQISVASHYVVGCVQIRHRKAALQPESPRRELAIDYSEIAQLAKESQAIRERLLADSGASKRRDQSQRRHR